MVLPGWRRRKLMFLLKDVDALYNQFADKAYATGALDAKTKELVALACSVMADCVPCIEWHYRQAAERGASDEEVSEVLAITMTIAAGSKRAKYTRLVEELRQAKKG
jgi:AhpD family alkylhydroperoxidase